MSEQNSTRAERRAQRKKKQRRRRILVLVLVLVVAAVGITAIVLRGRSRAAAGGLAATASRTYVVRNISSRDTVDVTGNIQAVRAHNHGFPGAGEVVELLVSEGQRVQEGDLLARQDDTQARYNLANLELTIEEQELAGNTRQVEVLRLQQALLQDALSDTELRAEFSGVVVNVPVEPGDRVAAGSPVVRVIDTSSLIAEVQISEFDVELLEVGMPVEFVFEALPDSVFTGYLSDIALEGTVSNAGLAQVPAELRIDNADPRVRPSYSFLADIIISDAEEVLAVEQAAILERAGRTLAIRADAAEGEQRLVPVRVEELDGGMVRVLSGLEAGDEILDASAIAEAAGERGAARQAGLFGAPAALPPGAGRALRVAPGGGPGGGDR